MIPGFITVRTTSSRLPQKCLLPFGDISIIEHIILRTKHYEIEPIICTTTNPEDDVIADLSEKEGVKCFRGSEKNKLQRWLDCCIFYNIEQFHSIDADDPFFDGEEMKRSFAYLKKGYDIVYPTESSSAGGASVGYSLKKDIIKKACALTKPDDDTEMMWYYIDKVKPLKKIILPESTSNPVQVRLTLDYPEDYWLLESVRRILGNFASRQEVDKLFKDNPNLYEINWFRNQEWKQGQLNKKI